MAEPIAGPSCEIKNNLVSKNGGTVLLRGGHQYYARRRHKSGLTVWSCTKRKICKGLLRVKDQQILEETPHDKKCTPDFSQNEIDMRILELKKGLNSPVFPCVPKTFNAMLSNLKDAGIDLIKKLPKFSSVKSTLYRQRNASAGVSKMVHTNVLEVEVPPRYQDFLLADYSNTSNNTRVIAFASQEARKLMCEVTVFYGDGTFASCSEPFEELYTVQADTGSTINQTNIVPMVYALMSNRKTETYVILFNMIKSQLPNWNPVKIKFDYEMAAMKAIKIVFPEIEVKGCFFHYNKAVFKKGKGLKMTGQEDLKASRLVQLSAVLPLLPEDQIVNGWIYIMARYGDSENAGTKEFVKYMQKQWLRKEFIKVWCVFGDAHRTTNAVESWHNKLNKTIEKKKPNLMHLLHVLKQDSSEHSVRKTLNEQNNPSKRKRARKNILKDEFIQEVQMELTQGQITVGHALEILRR